MELPAPGSSLRNDRPLFQFALLLPVAAVLWMALISKAYGQFKPGSADFRFWLHDAAALAVSAWAAGLLIHRVADLGRPAWEMKGSRSLLQIILLVFATGTAAWLGMHRVSWAIVQRGLLILAGIGLLLVLLLINRRAKAGHSAIVFLSVMLAAAAARANEAEGMSLSRALCRGWFFGGFLAGSISGLLPAAVRLRPSTGILRSLLGGYLFAAGAALSPLGWAGDFQPGAAALLLCGLPAAAKSLAVFVWQPEVGLCHSGEQAEQQRGKWVLAIGLVAAIAIHLVSLRENPESWRPLSFAGAATMGILLCTHLLRTRLSGGMRLCVAELSLLTPLPFLFGS